MNPVQNKNILILKEKLPQANKIILFSHVNPDGDSVGSCLGLYNYFHEQGKLAFVIIPNDIPDFLRGLPGAEEIIIGTKDLEKVRELIVSADLIFYLDFNEINRLDQLAAFPLQNKNAFHVMIDHHPGPDLKADLIFSDTGVSSTAELVFLIIKKILKPFTTLSLPVAASLFAGIMTDTGCFRYNASNPGTWETVAELIKTGIKNDEIYSSIYDNYSEHRMRLMGYALDKKMVILPHLHTGYIWLTKKELQKYHHVIGDTEGFVNLPLSVKDIRFSALFVEKDDRIKISFRSKGNFAVNKFSAVYFHGGGHLNAAGGESYENIQETLQRFEKLAHDFSDEI